ncbi:MAG TPA: ABC transporter ATP-binding protein [Candidatus Kapabacteria bacterium]|nr:ABC transporter ATP-binding protein [Candidatus Kapabacteria bacterium]
MIELINLSKQFGAAAAVNNVNLLIKDKEFIALVGPSGCGKTTLLRMLAGLEEPTRGKILVENEDITPLPPQQRKIGMVFQNYALFPHMTVRRNIEFGLRGMKIPAHEIKRRAEMATERVRLSHKLDMKVPFLSGGEQQRVALARAIVMEPRVLLFDEPLSNLDPLLREEMRKEILRVQRETKITSIYVTHDQSEALSLADRIVVMNSGNIEQFGTAEEVYFSPATPFVASFIGMAQLVRGDVVSNNATGLTVRVTNDCVFTLAKGPAIPLSAGEKVVLGIKPEAIIFTMGGNRATIIEQSFYGNTTEYVIDCSGLKLRARIAYSHKPDQRIGDSVTFHLDANLCSVFKA